MSAKQIHHPHSVKKPFLLILGFLILSGHNAYSQKSIVQMPNDSYYRQCTSFSISKPLRELVEQFPAKEKEQEHEAADSNSYRPVPFTPKLGALPIGEDPIRQFKDGLRFLPAPLVNFEGQTGSATPPDPTGAAGPNHYVQAINNQYRIYDKTGKPLISALNLNTLWPGSGNDGDPIVLYDKFADRWFIMQFNHTGGNRILIAISTTADPTGTYYQYTFEPTTSEFPDYPKFSIWADGYYQTANYQTDRAVVYEREKMLKGDKTAGMLVTLIPNPPNTGHIFCAFSFDADGQLPPYGSPNYLTFYEDDAWGTKDQIRLYKWSADWATKKATIVAEPSIPVSDFNGFVTTGFSDIGQPGTTNKIDAIDGMLSYRVSYRVWTGYNSAVLCHSVKLGSNLSGIRWYELRQDNTTKVWSKFQEGTYGPDDQVNRFLASIAMDNEGNIGMGYAVSNASTVYPGIRYTGRLAKDPLGEMGFKEQVAVEGTSAQTSGTRYGDYAHTSLDPDGITFWYTGEYMSAGKKTRIFSFRISPATPIHPFKTGPEFSIFQIKNTLRIRAKQLASNHFLQVDLFDIVGKLLKSKKLTPTSNKLETSFDVSDLEKGAYLVRLGNISFQKVVQVTVK